MKHLLPGTTIGLVGLGLVGTAIAQRLAAAGFQTLGFDVREEARAAFAAQGGAVAASVQAIGRVAHAVVLAVFDTAGVVAVVEGPQGLLAASPDGSDPVTVRTLIDCSTGTPQALADLAERLRARGIAFIEAPLSGSSRQIAGGQATLLLGGELQAIADNQPVLDAISAQRIHIGGAGMGAKAKLATNLVLGLNRAVLAEGMVLAERMGIAPASFLELVLATPATSGAAQAKGRMMVEGNFEPQSRIRQHLKDVKLMLANGAEQGQRLPLSETHAALMQAAIDAGDGELDNAAIIRQIRRETLDQPPQS